MGGFGVMSRPEGNRDGNVTHQPMILFETGPSGHGDVFASPHAMIVAREAGEVAAALDAADAARRDGKWLAGFVSYEAG
jgi:para-aminobenzoate synthetase component I